MALDIDALNKKFGALEVGVHAVFHWKVENEGSFRFVGIGRYNDGPHAGAQCAVKWFKSGLVFEASHWDNDMQVCHGAGILIMA